MFYKACFLGIRKDLKQIFFVFVFILTNFIAFVNLFVL